MANLGAAGYAGIAGTAMSSIGSIFAGNAAKNSADAEAVQLRAKAAARRGEAQAGAVDARRQSQLMQSRALALTAAGGGSVADPSVVNYMGTVKAEGEYAALSRLYEGYDEAGGLDYAAATRENEGKAARALGYSRGITTALSGAESLYSKYGAPPPAPKKKK
jgi:hypothetical protein